VKFSGAGSTGKRDWKITFIVSATAAATDAATTATI